VSQTEPESADSAPCLAPEASDSPRTPEASRLRDLSPQQWKSGIAAWLGWLFDGLDMHLYTIVAAPFVMQLVGAATLSDSMVREKSSWIQAAFLVGWALGGGFFGRIGDVMGRSRALALTILTYALFTGLSSLAQTWWQLLIFRFLAALGIGGEWAVGASLLSETWPKRWRPWIAAVLQTGVNCGVLLACLTTYLMAGQNPRYVFLVGVLPALLVFWIRRHVPEPAEWRDARARAQETAPGIGELFRGPARRTTLLTIGVCATSLTAWWAFMFWNQQHLRNLPELASWPVRDREQLVSKAFFLVILSSVAGNFFAGGLARFLGYRRAIALLCLGFMLSLVGTYSVPRDHHSLLMWIPWVGFFSGIFALFTMYLPPLFPTLLRTTGAGFCYNIGRVVAAGGTVFFGLFAQVGDFRQPLLYSALLFIPAMAIALKLPDLRSSEIQPG
jgi:MFS family permease